MSAIWLARDIGGGSNKDQAVHLFATEPFLGKAEDKEEGFFFSSAEHSRVTRYNRCPGDHLGFHQEYLKNLLQPGQKVKLLFPQPNITKGIRVAECCGSCKYRKSGYHVAECSEHEVIVATIQVCDKWELKE